MKLIAEWVGEDNANTKEMEKENDELKRKVADGASSFEAGMNGELNGAFKPEGPQGSDRSLV